MKRCGGFWIKTSVICSIYEYLTVYLFMTSVKTDLWSDVIWGPTEGSCGRAFKHALFAHAEVCQLTVTIFVKENVVQL